MVSRAGGWPTSDDWSKKTGSISTRVDKRRGCIIDNWVLSSDSVELHSAKGKDIQLNASHAVTNANDWTRHLISKMVDHVEQVARVIEV